jgi:hypothetical protein
MKPNNIALDLVIWNYSHYDKNCFQTRERERLWVEWVKEKKQDEEFEAVSIDICKVSL